MGTLLYITFFLTYETCFNSLQTGKHMGTAPLLSPVGARGGTHKTKRELRDAFFCQKFTPKIP